MAHVKRSASGSGGMGCKSQADQNFHMLPTIRYPATLKGLDAKAWRWAPHSNGHVKRVK